MATNDSPPTAPNQAVLFPAITQDYRVSKGKFGYNLVANRKIRKGDAIFKDSLEYAFADVKDGDVLLLDRHKKASRKNKTELPQYLPISQETLMGTHGVPTLKPDATGESAGIITWLLEVPGMLMNHSCDPNTTDYPPCVETGEAFASKTIQKGQELTCDYALLFYTEQEFDTCKCGALNCRGKVMGFQALSEEEKERLFPAATKAVQAMHLADTGQGPPVKVDRSVCASRLPTNGVIRIESQEFPERHSSEGVLRIVCPSPSCAHAKVMVKPKEGGREGEFSLFATRDCSVGEKVYDFWNQTWPNASPQCFDMVFGYPIAGYNDPPEGTVVHINARNCAQRNQSGHFRFSGWEMLTAHSCEPNVVYDDSDDSDDESDDEGFWRSAYATRQIMAGDELCVDMRQ